MKRSYKNSKSSSKKTFESTSNASSPPPLNTHTLILMKDPSGGASSSMHTASSSQMTSSSGVDLDPDPDPDPYSLLSSSSMSSSTSSSSLSMVVDATKYFVKEPKKVATDIGSLKVINCDVDDATNGVEPLTSFFEKTNQDEDEATEGVDDDGNREKLRSDSILQINSNNDNNYISSKCSINDKNTKFSNNNPTNNNQEDLEEITLSDTSSFTERFNKDFDGQVEIIADKVNSIMSHGSFYNCGLYQILSFLFVSIAWTIGNGWYAYVSVFSGYTPEHECDVTSMGYNFSVDVNDTKCSAIDKRTNTSVKCTKWTYDTSQMVSTIVTEFDFVCEKDYYFELAYSIEQIGYVIGTLIFSYLADVIGRKPVMVMVLISMSVFGLVQQFVTNFWIFMSLGLIINSLACGLEAVCVTLVLEMFSTTKRTFFGIGIEVVWVIVLASMSPLAYLIKKWREIRLVIFLVLSVLALISFWLCQESVRWLISMSKIDEARRIIDRIIKYNRLDKQKNSKLFKENKKNINVMLQELKNYNKMHADSLNLINSSPPIDSENPSEAAIDMATSTKRTNDRIIDLIKNPKFRIYMLIMALNWFATALVYDGLTYLNNYIGENIFINWVSMNLIELPAQFVCYLIISRYGRRLTTSFTLILAGVILLTSLIEMFEFVEKFQWIKLVIFVLAKFIVTQSYSSVILHAPELFPTSLRSFGYGICLFSGKITSIFSPMISIYLSKIMPRLPAIIYGIISITCGIISLYVPETLNRPLPNSIDDVVKWPRSLSKEEKKRVKKLNQEELSSIFKVFFSCCLKKKLKNLSSFAKKKTMRLVDREKKKRQTSQSVVFINADALNELTKHSSLLFEINKSQFIINGNDNQNNVMINTAKNNNFESNQSSSSLSSSSSSDSLSNNSLN